MAVGSAVALLAVEETRLVLGDGKSERSEIGDVHWVRILEVGVDVSAC